MGGSAHEDIWHFPFPNSFCRDFPRRDFSGRDFPNLEFRGGGYSACRTNVTARRKRMFSGGVSRRPNERRPPLKQRVI
jgi:hypothetical protein